MGYSLHDMAEIEERNGELEAENADLREQLADAVDRINELRAQLGYAHEAGA